MRCFLRTIVAMVVITLSTSALADDTSSAKIVRHDSPGKRAGGIVLTSIGGLFFTGGAALSIGAGVGIAGGRGDVLSAFDLLVGGAAMFVGLATGIPGIVLVATSGEKRVDEPRLAPGPRAFTFPLLRGTF